MDAAKLIEKMLAQRESWVELEPGLRVKVRRPAEAEFAQLRRGVTVETVGAFTVGWDGFSEATFVGSAIGSSDPLPFMPDLWREKVRDNVDWLNTVVQKLVALVEAHIEAKAATAKNSGPSST